MVDTVVWANMLIVKIYIEQYIDTIDYKNMHIAEVTDSVLNHLKDETIGNPHIYRALSILSYGQQIDLIQKIIDKKLEDLAFIEREYGKRGEE